MHVEILSELRTLRLHDGRRKLLEPLIVNVDGVTHTIPAGFDTDYSSIPALARWLVRWDKVDIAGVLHDYLYRTGQMTRREADAIWREVAMAGSRSANGVQGWLGWLGLRAGGWVAWRSHRSTD